MNKKQSLNNMTDELSIKIDSLIAECPSDWAVKAAEIMGIHRRGVYMIKNGQRTRRGVSKQIELIEALKKVRSAYLEQIEKALL
jgi:hypothetical protein